MRTPSGDFGAAHRDPRHTCGARLYAMGTVYERSLRDTTTLEHCRACNVVLQWSRGKLLREVPWPALDAATVQSHEVTKS